MKLSDLAVRPDLRLGLLLISPSRRLVEGPEGKVNPEPVIMQVLLALIDQRDKVVTRNELFDQVWGGAMVGDDSLNRAVAGVRRIGAETAPGLYEIETIPRTGYRLTISGGIEPDTVADENERPATAEPRFTRRSATAAALAVGIAAGGLGLLSIRSRQDREFNELMERGENALEFGDPSADPAQYFQRAIALRPDDPKAHGLFAYSRAHFADYFPGSGRNALDDAERSIGAALALDPQEPNARLAKVLLQRSMLDLVTSEDRMREILATNPDNIEAMRQMWNFLQSAGRSREALALVERAIALKPMAASSNFPRAQLLWILGRNAEADRVIDRAMQYWPTHRFVRFAQFIILAFTGRPRAALTMLENENTRPQIYTPAAVALWRVSLKALEERSAQSIAAARSANLASAKQDLTRTSQAIMTLSALGDVDAAFEIANGLLLFERPVAVGPQPAGGAPQAKSTAWRFSPWLFTPPIAPMRADPRFDLLCEGIGLTEYWAKRGITPDYRLGFS